LREWRCGNIQTFQTDPHMNVDHNARHPCPAIKRQSGRAPERSLRAQRAQVAGSFPSRRGALVCAIALRDLCGVPRQNSGRASRSRPGLAPVASSRANVSRLLRRHGLARRSAIEPAAPLARRDLGVSLNCHNPSAKLRGPVSIESRPALIVGMSQNRHHARRL